MTQQPADLPFDALLAEAAARSRRHRAPIAVALIDAGRLAVESMTAVVTAVRAVLRGGDKAEGLSDGRVAVLLNDCDDGAAVFAGRRILDRSRRAVGETGGRGAAGAVFVGIACFDEAPGEAQEMLRAAERAAGQAMAAAAGGLKITAAGAAPP